MSSSRYARTLVPIAVLVGAVAIASGARAGDNALTVVAVHLPAGGLYGSAPCDGGALVRKASLGVPATGLAAYAELRDLCGSGDRVSVLEEKAGAGDVYLPTRVTEDGSWVSGADGARLVRGMSLGMRDLDFQPAESLGTRGPDLVTDASKGDVEPEGFTITVQDPVAASWFRSATAWIGDPDRIGVAAGTSVLATCSSLTESCMVTLPVCADVAVDLEARGVRTPQSLGASLVREYRIAREAFCPA